MTLDQLNILLPTYLLAACRVAGVVAFAPVLGSTAIPRKIQQLIALALTLGLMPAIGDRHIPQSPTVFLSAALEFCFGVVLGMSANLVFLAAHWAGEIIGQQMGFTLSGLLDPHTGSESSILGETYLAFAALVFLVINGHHALIRALALSFDSLPLLSITINRSLFDTFMGLVQSATILSLQLAAPLLLTMLIVDFSLGVMTRIVPQLNVMAMGMSLRSAVGLVLLLLLIALTAQALGSAMTGWMKSLDLLWTPRAAGGLT
jgi:flagellar biosynthetic protein FliR